MEIEPKFRSRAGVYVAGVYILLAVGIFVLTAFGHHDDGMEWIPFALLASPWFQIGQRLLIPGLIANAILLYAIGTIIGTAVLRIREK